MRISARPLLAGIACLLVSTACGSAATSPSTQLYQPPTDFQISVSAGMSPTISWPSGGADDFSITDLTSTTATQQIAWSLSDYSQDGGIGSPVTYGVLPARASCTVVGIVVDDACPVSGALIAGHTYLVIIALANGELGEKEFVP